MASQILHLPTIMLLLLLSSFTAPTPEVSQDKRHELLEPCQYEPEKAAVEGGKFLLSRHCWNQPAMKMYTTLVFLGFLVGTSFTMPVPESTLANNFDGQSTLYVVTEDADLDVDTTGPAITTVSIPRPRETEASAESITTSTPQATEAAVESTTTPAPQSTEPAAESTKIPETTSPKAFNCDGKDPDLYPDPEDCTKYYECVGGFADPFHRSCSPGGPVFDPKKKYCDWPENVALPCGQVSADVPNAAEEDAVATFTCEGKAPGIHPDPENCDKFYQCVPGHPGPYQRDCPPGGLVFDAELQVCNWPWAVQAPCGTLPTEFRNRQ